MSKESTLVYSHTNSESTGFTGEMEEKAEFAATGFVVFLRLALS